VEEQHRRVAGNVNVELLHLAAQNNPVAVLYYEPRRPRGVSIVAGHGYSSSKHNLDFLCYFLAAHGFGAYSLDFPGHKLGASGGRLRGVDDCVDAMQAAVRRAREDGNANPYTMGHSMGAMTALFAAALDPEIRGTVAIATGYGRPTAVAERQSAGVTDFRSGYVDGITLPELVAGIDAEYDRLLPRLAGRETLYVAASRDAMVNPESVRELFDRAPEPKTFEIIESDHTYAAENARSAVLQWLNERHPRT
jgi:pimeloyl-ACP methyl ester carboxylesterase